jgi:hypothetical protein
MMNDLDKIKVMLSSTVTDLIGERDAIKSIFKEIDIVELEGCDPVNENSVAGSSRITTIDIARQSDLYILILGSKFGLELMNGKSATEVEFDAAFKSDPTKILVFLKQPLTDLDDKQKEFIEKVQNYYNGYWRTSFTYTHDLQVLVRTSFTKWLKERASIGYDLNYLDHFVRMAKQRKPEPTANVYYKVSEDLVELEYRFWNSKKLIQFSKPEIYKNFWGCLSALEDQFDVWIDEEQGHGQ